MHAIITRKKLKINIFLKIVLKEYAILRNSTVDKRKTKCRKKATDRILDNEAGINSKEIMYTGKRN